MSKQKEIREELIKYFTPPNTTFKGNPILKENITQVVDGLLEFEDKLGVVILGDKVPTRLTISVSDKCTDNGLQGEWVRVESIR